MADRPAAPPGPSGDGKAPVPARAEPQTARRVSSEQVFNGAAEVQIDHHGVVYRLRRTALGKLILTK
jgi:hemin uptake protein HemP